MKRILRLFGVEVASYEQTYDPSELYFPNTGGQFELAFEDEIEDDGEDEEAGFGFRSR